MEIRSERTAEIAGKYASCNDADGLNQYNISIPLEAKKLIVTFDDFGPFTSITAVIDL